MPIRIFLSRPDWLFGATGIFVCILSFFIKNEIDIPLHDTFFIVSGGSIFRVLSLFLMLNAIFYAIFIHFKWFLNILWSQIHYFTTFIGLLIFLLLGNQSVSQPQIREFGTFDAFSIFGGTNVLITFSFFLLIFVQIFLPLHLLTAILKRKQKN
jgi:hypothetical protein